MSPRKLARRLLSVPPIIVCCPVCGMRELLESPVLVLLLRTGDVCCSDCEDAHRGRVELIPYSEEDLP